MLNPVVVIGRRPVGKEVAALAVHVQEFDPWPFEDEHASSMVFGKPRVIEVKRGENNEDQPINMVVGAAQKHNPSDSETGIVVDVRVTVNHVP